MEYTKKDFLDLFENKLPEKEARQMLVTMYERGESENEIALGAMMMRKFALDLPLDEDLRANIVDCCGTGGDHSQSFNISTTVALLCSSVGVPMAKHGNKGITSKSGSADVLERLGININLDPTSQVKLLQETNFAFIYALHHHSVMKHIMPIRKSIPHRTIFNLLGPLAHPARATKQLIGVFSKDYLLKMAKALQILNSKKAMIVSSADGMDEISMSAVTHFAVLDKGEVSEGIIDPREFGFELSSKGEIAGGDPSENAKITYDILKGDLLGAKRDIVLINACFVLLSGDKARDFQEAKEILVESLESKKAIMHLKNIIDISQKV